MNPTQRAWTYNEEWILRQEYPKKPTAEVAKMLRRSIYAVNVRASHLGLKKRHYGLVWTEQMLKLLRDYYPTMINYSLSRLIGVSQRTMIRKARELGLEKTDDFMEINRKSIRDSISAGLKRHGPQPTHFQKGVRANPEGEFKPGYRESPETKAKRSASLKETWKRKKILKRYGLSSLSKG